MDVSLFGGRLFSHALLIAILAFFSVSCGNRFDLSTERGRQSRIDDANFHLSRGECTAALEAINPLYASSHVTDEVRIITASAYACMAGFNLLKFVEKLASGSNIFQSLAISLSNGPGDNAQSFLYDAVDVLTNAGTAMNGARRAASVNTYMVFVQMGVVSALLRNYGNPSSTGAQGTNLSYNTLANPAGEMADQDACALTAAFSFLSDSYSHSDLNDADTGAAITSLNAICTAAGVGACSSLNRDRTACDGTNANSVTAQAVVGSVNASW